MSRFPGGPQYGGRTKLDPNIVHPYTPGRGHRYPKRAALRKAVSGGKIPIGVEISPELYDQILDEAIQSKKSFQRLVLELISAGMSPE